ncbi:tetratricopeptide repeat protein [[Pseudomonas] boreopolis]|uniref:vWA domain-containing protein n=1 Tax=Xanthomonas boreopolis TaxID=86183 RepID=UPI003DA082D0
MNAALQDWNAFLGTLHFLRPGWLWALLAVPLAVALWVLRRRRGEVWKYNVDAHLLPHLLVPGTRRAWGGLVALVLGTVLAILALAGPSWRQQEQPLYRPHQPLVIALDLSTSALAGDLPPSRLLQARAKLATLLRERRGGDVALLAYAGESFTVAPLTEDAANVALFLDALSPDVMPVDGKRADRAIEAAASLLAQAGYRQGDILLLTDQADARTRAAAAAALQRGFRVSALGLGTANGSAYRDLQGRIEQARLDEDGLRALAGSGGGRYARLTVDDADLRSLGVLDPARAQAGADASSNGQAWLDDGYWLLPPVMLLALLAFRRRGVAASVLALGLCLPLAFPARAADEGGWWRRADQVRQQRIEQGVQAYRKGDFARAQQAFDGIDSDEAQYNLGNALARQGRYDDAIAAYDRALALHPGMPDAVANRAAVEAARKRRQNGQKQGQSGQQEGRQPPSSSSPGNGTSQPPQDARDRSSQQDDGQAPSQQEDPRQDKPQAGQGRNGKEPPPQDPKAEDAQAQQQANRAQQQRMQQALDRQDPARKQDAAATRADETPQQREQRQAVEAWMRRVPDDPGSLLRAKFRLEYERKQREGQ